MREPVLRERTPTGQEFIQHDSQAENVGPPIDQMAFTANLFRTHVRQRADDRVGLAVVFLSQRHAEVGQIRPVVEVEQNVGRLNVAMDDSFQMGDMDGLGHLSGELSRCRECQGCSFDLGRQIGPLDILGDDKAPPVFGPPAVKDGDDGRVIELSENAGLDKIPCHVFWPLDAVRMRHLDRDLAAEFFIVGEKHAPEAAVAQNTQDLIATNPDRTNGVDRGRRTVGRDAVLGGDRLTKRLRGRQRARSHTVLGRRSELVAVDRRSHLVIPRRETVDTV